MLARNCNSSTREDHGFRASLGCKVSSVAGQPELLSEIISFFLFLFVHELCHMYAVPLEEARRRCQIFLALELQAADMGDGNKL